MEQQNSSERVTTLFRDISAMIGKLRHSEEALLVGKPLSPVVSEVAENLESIKKSLIEQKLKIVEMSNLEPISEAEALKTVQGFAIDVYGDIRDENEKNAKISNVMSANQDLVRDGKAKELFDKL